MCVELSTSFDLYSSFLDLDHARGIQGTTHKRDALASPRLFHPPHFPHITPNTFSDLAHHVQVIQGQQLRHRVAFSQWCVGFPDFQDLSHMLITIIGSTANTSFAGGEEAISQPYTSREFSRRYATTP